MSLREENLEDIVGIGCFIEGALKDHQRAYQVWEQNKGHFFEGGIDITKTVKRKGHEHTLFMNLKNKDGETFELTIKKTI